MPRLNQRQRINNVHSGEVWCMSTDSVRSNAVWGISIDSVHFDELYGAFYFYFGG